VQDAVAFDMNFYDQSFAADAQTWGSDPFLISEPYPPSPIRRGVILGSSFENHNAGVVREASRMGLGWKEGGATDHCNLFTIERVPLPPKEWAAEHGAYHFEFSDMEDVPPPAPFGLMPLPIPLDFMAEHGVRRDPMRAEVLAEEGKEEFVQGDSPLCLPQDLLFQLLVTSLYLRAISAHLLGNSLLDFIRSRLAAPALKLRRTKFTAKAEVRHHRGDCTVKLRVYRVASGLFAVELQRRAGDVVAFTGIFGELVEYLSDRFQLAEGQPTAGVKAPESQPRRKAGIAQSCHWGGGEHNPNEVSEAGLP